ncbi:MAG: DUF4386 domain-containing protein [Desulfobacterales bacterium]|nr:DUF4386 domain-containing protein [Desulfobacterales bacterium]
MNNNLSYKTTGITIIFHILLINIGFLILMNVFEFPDILRTASEHRLQLFNENRNVIVPVYYILALSGFSQVVMSITIYQILDKKKSTILLVGTVFGVLTGLFQALGFVRWVVLLPYISDLMSNTDSNISLKTLITIEGVFNRYAGMSVGEHLGFVSQAIWTILVGFAITRSKKLKSIYGWIGLFIGVLTIPMSFESLGEEFSYLKVLVSPVMIAWSIWLIAFAIHTIRIDDKD